MFEKINTLYLLIATIVGGAGGAIKWWFNHKANKKKAENESSAVLFAALEELKKKVVASVLREVAMTNKLAEKDILIEGLRLHCPECYIAFMEKLNENGPQDN